METWEPLGRVPASSLVGSRVTLHWAAQIVAAVGATWLDPSAGSHHTALSWLDSARAFAGQPLPRGTRALLVVEALSLAVAGPDGVPTGARFSLAGRTLADGLTWLASAIRGREEAPPRQLVCPVHDLPPRSIDAPFEPIADALGELARWYANAALLLASVARAPGASPVHCWPHHFDIATLIALDKDKTSEHARSIGVGLSPGDGSYAEPYWYVTPWPYHARDRLPPALSLGHWHTEGWFGAVLTASELFAADAAAQPARTRTFVDVAIDKSRMLLA